MIEKISEFIDLKLLCIFLVALISFLTLKILYRKVSLPKFLQVTLTLLVIVANSFLVYMYITDEESTYINTTKEYYVVGTVRFTSSAIDKIRIEYTKTNMVIQDLEKNEILVRVSNSTGIYDRAGKKIPLDSIKTGDTIIVRTTKATLKNGQNEIVARKIQKN